MSKPPLHSEEIGAVQMVRQGIAVCENGCVATTSRSDKARYSRAMVGCGVAR